MLNDNKLKFMDIINNNNILFAFDLSFSQFCL